MFVEMLSHTPLWVFGLFIFLIMLGLQQSRSRTVEAKIIFLLPIGMMFLSFMGLISSFGVSLLPILLWASSLLSLVIVTYRFFPLRSVRYNQAHKLFHIQGSWVPLALMMAIFFTKYFVGVVSSLKPEIVTSVVFTVLLSSLYGVYSGIFMGRAANILKMSIKQAN